MNLAIFSLIYLCILRLLYFPIFGDLSTLASGGTSVIFGLTLSSIFKVDNSTLFIILYSILLFFISVFTENENFFLVLISFFETLTPFIILGTISTTNFKNYVKRNIFFFKRGIILLVSILLFGQLLNLIGFPLPSLANVPITEELIGKFNTDFSVTSFVGSSAPYSLCLSFLLISLQILYPKFYTQFFIFGIFILLFSFSRLGLATFIVFNLIMLVSNLIRFIEIGNLRLNKNLSFIAY